MKQQLILKLRIIIIVCFLIIAGGGAAWFIITGADGNLRAELLDQARLMTQVLNGKSVQNLSGTSADIDSPDYQTLKQTLISLRKANANYRFLYLMGRDSDGGVFIYVDSEPSDSPDYSPPGQIYAEAPVVVSDVFETNLAAVDGPYTDRWGTWISALVPLIDPTTGETISVVGMDVAAGNWNWNVAGRSAVPLGMLSILLMVLFVSYIAGRQSQADPKPLLARLLPPLAATLILLLGVILVLFIQQQKRLQTEQIAAKVASVGLDFDLLLEQQTEALSMAVLPIALNPDVQKDLKIRNSGELLQSWQPIFKALQQQMFLSDFDFLDAQRICLLRAYDPARCGDRIEHEVVLQAELTGQQAFGMALGNQGTLAYWVVQPVYQDGALIGYVEAGKDIENILQDLEGQSKVHLAVLVHKQFLNQQTWEEGMRLLGKQPDWGRIESNVVAYTSLAQLPDSFIRWADQSTGVPVNGQVGLEFSSDGKDLQVSTLPLYDSAGKEVGELLIIIDFSAEKTVLNNRIIVATSVIGVLVFTLVAFVFVLIYRTDKYIRIQQQKLESSENQFRSMFLNHSAVMLLIEPKQGRILDANSAASQFYGYSRDKLKSMLIKEINTLDPNQIELERLKALQNRLNFFVFRHKLASGELRDVETYSTPIEFGGETVLFSVIHDITERKQVEGEQQEVLHRLLKIASRVPGVVYQYLLHPDGSSCFPFASEAINDIYRVTPEEVRLDASKVFSRLHPDDYAGVVASIQISARDLTPWVYEYRVKFEDGTVRSLSGNAMPQRELDGSVLWHGFISDITERKNTEELLHKSEEKYRLMFTALNEGVILHDAKGKIIANNPAAEQMLGLSHDQILGMTSMDSSWHAIHPDGSDFPGEMHPAMITLRTGQPVRNEVVGVYKPSGELIWLNINSEPLFNPGESVPYAALSSFADITKRLEAEAALQQEKNSLAKLLAVSEEFLAKSDKELDFQDLTDNLLKISGGRFAVFNLFEENGKDFRTIAISGVSDRFMKITSVLGFDLSGKKWPQDDVREEKTRGKLITRFGSLLDLTGDALPKSVLSLVKKLFNPGEAVVAKIVAHEKTLGDFTIIMPSGKPFGNDNLVSIYLRQVGLLMQRKRAEAALVASQLAYRQLVEQIPEVIYTDEIGGSWQYIGPNIYDLCGYTAEELLADPKLWMDRIYIEDRDQLNAQMKALASGDTLNAEYRIHTRDRGLIWVRDHGVIKEDRSTGKKLLQGLLSEITQEKEIELAQKESEARFRILYDNSPIALHEEDFSAVKQRVDGLKASGVVDFDAYLRQHPEVVAECIRLVKVVDVNNASLKLFGASKKSDMMTNLALTLTEAESQSFRNELVWIASGATHFELETVNRTMDARIITVKLNWTAFPGHENDLSKVIVSIIDITEQKKAEAAIRESEEKFKAIISSSPDGIGMASLDGKLVLMSEALVEMYGYGVDEKDAYLGKTVFDFIDPSSHVALKNSLRNLKRGGKPGVSEYLAVRKDGSRFSVESNLTILRNSEGERVGQIFVQRDITSRKQAEAELRETNRQLEAAIENAKSLAVEAEKANIAKSEFLANMSHEIRTPMNGVIGMTGLLLDTSLDEEQRRYAEIVRSSGESLLSLINDILDFSKIEAGKLDLETIDFDLLSLLDDFGAVMAVRAQQKGLELLCAADPGVPVLLKGDPGRLRQILTNLVGNAIKFTLQGEVAVRVHCLRETDGEVELRFSVRDTGIGIPPEKIGMLFNKFTQVDASTTRQYGGTGLGLAISKQLAELMGGKIGVISQAGQGSEFWFTARLGISGENKLKAPPIPASLRDVRILIVDDNATSREILNVRLESWGMRPSEVEGGAAALKALAAARAEGDPFRIAVLDLQMPDMDGATLGETIKRDQNLKETCLILLSSLGDRGDEHLFAQIGFVGYMVKPLRHLELFKILSTILAQHEMARADGAAAETLQKKGSEPAARETRRFSFSSGTRILLVEDNITNQQVAMGILRKFGLKVEAAANGIEALAALESVPYDLVLMDVQMPEMDGLEATRQIRNERSNVLNHGLPIVAMTAHAFQEDRDRCMAAGMNDYLTKPIQPQALVEMLERWLPEKSEADNQLGKKNSLQSNPQSIEPQIVVFDWEGLMRRLMGDEELAVMVIEGFLDDMPKQIQALKDYLETNDIKSAGRQAHTIKGASANIGGEALRATAYEIEKAGNAGNIVVVKSFVAQLEADFDRLSVVLRKQFSSTSRDAHQE